MLKHTGRSVWWRRDSTKPARRAGLYDVRPRRAKLVYLFLAIAALARLSTAQSTLALTFGFYSNLADVGQTGNWFGGTATGGTAPYSFALSGSVPPGVGRSASGANVTVTGTPTSVANYAFTVTVTDSRGFTASKGLDLDVLQDVPTLHPFPPLRHCRLILFPDSSGLRWIPKRRLRQYLHVVVLRVAPPGINL